VWARVFYTALHSNITVMYMFICSLYGCKT